MSPPDFSDPIKREPTTEEEATIANTGIAPVETEFAELMGELLSEQLKADSSLDLLKEAADLATMEDITVDESFTAMVYDSLAPFEDAQREYVSQLLQCGEAHQQSADSLIASGRDGVILEESALLQEAMNSKGVSSAAKEALIIKGAMASLKGQSITNGNGEFAELLALAPDPVELLVNHPEFVRDLRKSAGLEGKYKKLVPIQDIDKDVDKLREALESAIEPSKKVVQCMNVMMRFPDKYFQGAGTYTLEQQADRLQQAPEQLKAMGMPETFSSSEELEAFQKVVKKSDLYKGLAKQHQEMLLKAIHLGADHVADQCERQIRGNAWGDRTEAVAKEALSAHPYVESVVDSDKFSRSDRMGYDLRVTLNDGTVFDVDVKSSLDSARKGDAMRADYMDKYNLANSVAISKFGGRFEAYAHSSHLYVERSRRPGTDGLTNSQRVDKLVKEHLVSKKVGKPILKK